MVNVCKLKIICFFYLEVYYKGFSIICFLGVNVDYRDSRDLW